MASSAGSLTSQSFCGARRIRAPLAPPRLSVPRKLAADAHAVETSCEIGQPRVEELRLERRDVGVADQLVVDRGDRVLPQLRLRDPRAEVARQRAHVAVQQLVPGLGERVGELVGVLVEALRRSARRSGPACSARSVVSIIGACRFDGSWASGTVSCASGFFGVHCFAPAGLVVSSHS